MAARTRQLAQMAQALMALAGERDVAVGARRRPCRLAAAAATAVLAGRNVPLAQQLPSPKASRCRIHTI